MAGGYQGELLFVNSPSGLIMEELLLEAVYRGFVGGVGLGIRILYERMKPEVDLFSANERCFTEPSSFSPCGVGGCQAL
jgi:aldehyde:ferredoxin oxidoreductase